MKNNEVYVISTTTVYEDGDVTIKISQEAYSSYEKAVKFCESRDKAEKIANNCYWQPIDNGFIRGYRYQILILTLV